MNTKRCLALALALSCFITCLSAWADPSDDVLEVYPVPPGIKASPAATVTVAQGHKRFDSFVYYSTPLANDADNAQAIRHGVIEGINENNTLRKFFFDGKAAPLETEQSCSWTCFSFKGEASVEIRSPRSPIESFKILPSSAGIEGKLKDGALTFGLNEPRKLAIVLNGDYLNPLFLFADAPEQGVPDKQAPGTLVFKNGDNPQAMRAKAKAAKVLYFEPGVYDIGIAFEIYSNQTVYLEGGSYLLGTLHGIMASNVTIRGRGVLAGDTISRQQVLNLKRELGYNKRVVERLRYHAINMLSEQNETSWNAFADHPGSGCDNLTIEGITIASPRQFFIRATGVPMTIYNVKMVGSWPYNTDGVSTIGQAHTTVYDCFFHCNDDAIYVSPNFCHIHHCVFWQGNNGCVFQFHWGSSPVNEQGGYVHDCDIVHVGHVAEANNRMVIGSRKSGPGDLKDVTFKNIRIEGPVWSFLRLETNGAGNLGSFENILFENISINGPALHKSRIISSKGRKDGEESNSWIRNITFRNVTINGEPFSEQDLEIGDFQVENISIEPSTNLVR